MQGKTIARKKRKSGMLYTMIHENSGGQKCVNITAVSFSHDPEEGNKTAHRLPIYRLSTRFAYIIEHNARSLVILFLTANEFPSPQVLKQ